MQLQEFLALLTNIKGGPSQFTAQCPAHKDRTNSLSIGTGEDGRILLFCHAGCTHEAVLAALNLPANALFSSSAGPTAASFRSAFAKTPGKRTRGETDLQKCKNQAKTSPSCEVVYPYTDATGALLFEVIRRQNEDGTKTFRQRQWISGKPVYNLTDIEPTLYHLPMIRKEIDEGAGIIVLCEGEKDADQLCALGYTATTAPMGAGKWRESYTKALANAVKVIILPDNDAPGRAHALKVSSNLQQAGVTTEIIDLTSVMPNLPSKGDVSDVLDFLGNDAADAIFANPLRHEAFAELAARRNEEEQRPAYQFSTVASYLQTRFYKEVEKEEQRNLVTTGFAVLDSQLGGGMYPGLYVIGSVSSLGKTAFCLQIADYIAKNGVDVLFFTLEMSRLEMVARSLVRTVFVQSRCTLPYGVGDVFSGQINPALFKESASAYEQGAAQHLALLEGGGSIGVEDIAKQALAHKEATGRAPVVMVDYLQILRPADVRMSDKQAMDHAVVELKRLSRQLSAPVVAVSSFNRQNYTEEVNFASFKESGAIEYSADVVLGLQARGVSRDADSVTDEKKAARLVRAATKKVKQKDPRPLELVLLKNRRGPAWACFGLDFYPKQNFFLEAER